MNRSKKTFLGRVSVLKGLFVASLVAAACSSKSGGSESNFVACSDDGDCHGGVCVSGRCEAGTTGSGGQGLGGNGPLDAGSGGATGGTPGSDGGNHPGGGTCNTGGFYTYVSGGAGGQFAGGSPGSGGSGPSCPVDDRGFATEDHDAFCHDFACPDTAAALLKGLSCTQEGAGAITLTVGCGGQKIAIHSEDMDYAAWLDPTAGTLIAAEGQYRYPFGTCSAFGYRTGTVPADCPSAKTYACERNPPVNGCRSPQDPGCNTCCAGEYNGYCEVHVGLDATSTTYYTYTGLPGPCPCNCQPCACTPEQEAQLRAFPARPECGCPAEPPPLPTGGTTGAGGSGTGGTDPCGNTCGWKADLQRACPGITP